MICGAAIPVKGRGVVTVLVVDGLTAPVGHGMTRVVTACAIAVLSRVYSLDDVLSIITVVRSYNGRKG